MRDAGGNVIRAIGTVEDISARKLAEERLKEVARFVDENPSPVLRVADDGTILYANASSERLLKRWRTATRGKIPRTIQRRLGQWRLENNHLPLDLPVGERTLSVLVVPVRDRGYVNLYARDVTEQRRLQKAAEEGKRTLDALMEYIPEGVTIANVPNASTLRISRYAEERLLQGGVFWGALAGTIAQRSESVSGRWWYAGSRWRTFPSGGRRYLENGWKAKSSCWNLQAGTGPILSTAGPIRDDQGRIIGAVAAWRDISDWKKTEAALLESENRYRSMFENSHAIMLLIDPDSGKIVDANPAAERFYGWRRDELASMSISQINVLTPDELAVKMTAAKYAPKERSLWGSAIAEPGGTSVTWRCTQVPLL